MLISHRKKFIFTKTVKTAGTSIESYFEKYCMPEGEWKQMHKRSMHVSQAGIIGHRGKDPQAHKWYNHMSAKKIKDRIGEEIWNEYLKFTIVRNPYDKLISGFYYKILYDRKRTKIRRITSMILRILKLDGMMNRIKGKDYVVQFREWIREGGGIYDKKQCFIDGEEVIDYYIRYEHMNEDMKELCDRLDIPFNPEEIPQFKKGTRKYDIPIKDFYDEATIKIVEERYAWDLERFGYTIPE